MAAAVTTANEPAALGALFVMWTVMMAGMMVPTVVPWLVLIGRLAPTTDGPGSGWSVGQFLGGYVLAWTGFSLLAALTQRLLSEAALTSPMGVPTRAATAGVLLVVAGLYQLTPVKERCLTHCRSPFAYFLSSWRGGAWGALRMGLHHGLYCVGCCWALMLLAFVAGVMNAVWMIGVTAYAFADQVLLKTVVLSRAVGVALVVWGLLYLAGG